MLPVLYKFTFDTPMGGVLFYLLGAALVAYGAWSGWRGAMGPVNPATGEAAAASQSDKVQRAVIFGVLFAIIVLVGSHWALPNTLFGKGKNEGIPIHTYGLLIGGGFLAAVTVLAWMARRDWPGEEGERKREQMFDLLWWVAGGAFLGSRILFILVNWKDHAANPSMIFSLAGGVVFYGGLIGAAIAAYIFARRNDIDFLRLSDLALPTVSLGASLGRLGCYAAGCCWGDIAAKGQKLTVHFPGSAVKTLFGTPGGTASMAYQSQAADGRYVMEATGEIFHQAVPGAVKISEWAAQHAHTLPVHPTQLFESLGHLVLFLSLMAMRRFRRFHGQIAAFWLMGYAIVRTLVELVRGDVERGTLHGLLNYLGATSLAGRVPLEAWFNISVSQFISLCMFALGAAILYRQGRARSAAAREDLTALAAA